MESRVSSVFAGEERSERFDDRCLSNIIRTDDDVEARLELKRCLADFSEVADSEM